MKKLMLAALAALTLGLGAAQAAQTGSHQGSQYNDPAILRGGGG
jgi:hypothetical protein